MVDQFEMDVFEVAFNAQQNTLLPSERVDEDTQSTIIVDQFVEVVGWMPRNSLRGQGNTSSLVIRTPVGYRLDPSCSLLSRAGTSNSTARSHTTVNFEEMERRPGTTILAPTTPPTHANSPLNICHLTSSATATTLAAYDSSPRSSGDLAVSAYTISKFIISQAWGQFAISRTNV
jgi:hypothetical protein